MDKSSLISSIVLLWAFPILADTQESNPFSIDMTNFALKTPESASFLYHGKESINEYNGNPGISIPLMELSSKDISLPIVLSYDGTAIKTTQESSWVGLGWSMNIGGCINYVPAGKNDNSRSVEFNWSQIEPLFSNENERYIAGLEGLGIFSQLPISFNDVEQDFYNVSVGGKSFSFFIHPSSNPNSPQYCIIGEYDEDYEIQKMTDGWIIKDGDGFSYYFTAYERNGVFVSLDNITELLYPYMSAWRLSKIISPQRAEINFSYSTSSIKYSPSKTLVTHYVDSVLELSGQIGQLPSFLDARFQNVESNYENTVEEQLLLDSIFTDEWTLIFNKSSREDVEAYNYPALKLSSIILRSNLDGNPKKRICFHHDYFNTTDYTSTSISSSPNTSPYLTKRLKLDSLTIGLGNSPDVYRFSYDTHMLPNKRSLFSDPWGCCNGIRQEIMHHRFVFRNEKRDRVSPSNLTSGMLTSIQYPTGGRTDYEYEPNTFVSNDCPLYQLTDSLYYYIGASHHPNETSSRTIEIHDDYEGVLHFSFWKPDIYSSHSNSNARIRLFKPNFNGGSNHVIFEKWLRDFSPVGYQEYLEDEEPILLSSGLYVLEAVLPEEEQFAVSASVTLKSYHVTDYSIGGGVRVKTIRNYDHLGHLSHSVDFDYNNENGRTSGTLLYPFRQDKYYPYIPCCFTQYGRFFSDTIRYYRHDISCKNVTAVSNVWLGGNDVGYSTVSKIEKDKYGNIIRKTTSNYSNSTEYEQLFQPIVYYSNVSNLRYANIGKILCQKIYDRFNHPLMQTDYHYNRLSSTSYFIGSQYQTVSVPTVLYGYYHANESFALLYDYTNAWTVLDAKTEINFDSGMPTIQNRISETYLYNPSSRNISAISRTTNSGDTVCDFFEYDDVIPKLPVRHTRKSRIFGTEGEGISVMESDYGFIGLRYLLLGKMLHFGSNASPQELSDQITYRYDNHGNVIEEIKNNLERTVCFWGYRGKYPVAIIQGMSYDDVMSRLSTTSYERIYNGGVHTISDELESLRRDLHDIPVATYTYNPQVGISSETSPSGETISYEYDSDGRLVTVKNHEGHTLATYSYHNTQR